MNDTIYLAFKKQIQEKLYTAIQDFVQFRSGHILMSVTPT